MEHISNCCGASIDGLNADNIGICSECKEGCGVEEAGMQKMDLLSYKEEDYEIGIIAIVEKINEIISKLSDTNQ